MATFSSLDYSFRRGTSKSLDSTAIENGSFNICEDSGELYIDLDNFRIPMNSVKFGLTLAEIKALDTPGKKLYLASDTGRLLAYDSNALSWITIGGDSVGSADYATKAKQDIDGNNIIDYYCSKTEVSAFNNDYNARLNALSKSVGAVVGFSTKVLDDGESLPTTGDPKVLYFKKDSTASDGTTIYSNWIWVIDDTDSSKGSYAKVGSTALNLSDYMTASQVDAKDQVVLATLRSEISAVVSQINALSATIETEQAKQDKRITVLEKNTVTSDSLVQFQAQLDQITTDNATNKTNISTINDTITALKDGNTTDTIATLRTAIDTNTASIKAGPNLDDITAAYKAADAVIQSNLNTVNTNLTTKINANTSNISANKTLISTNSNNITTLTNRVANDETNISTNTTNIATNKTNIATNASNIATNTTNIATNASNIATNATNIATNKSDIATLKTQVATNTSNIAINKTNISTNATAIATINSTLVSTYCAADTTSTASGVTTQQYEYVNEG